MFIGLGTVANVVAIAAGTGLGVLAGHRFTARTRTLITQVLGLFTVVLGGSAIASGLSDAFSAAVGSSARLLIVLGALLIGGILGSALRIEDRLDAGVNRLHQRFSRGEEDGRFVEGAVTATLVFCIGPLAILGSLSDGLGLGAEQLLVKSVMDGFAAIAFASSFGVGVLVSAIPVALYQGLLTLLGFGLGNFLPAAQVDALGATGGVILLGLGFRLAGIAKIPVGDLVLAPMLVAAVEVLV